MHDQRYEYIVIELSVTYDSYKNAVTSALNIYSKDGWRFKELVVPKHTRDSGPFIIFERESLAYKEYNSTVHNFLENGNNI